MGVAVATVAVIIPAMRPHRIANVVQSILDTTPDPEIVVVATGDCAKAASELPVTVIDDGGGHWPERLNRGYGSTTANYIHTGADDLRYHPNWFESAMLVMNQFPDGWGVVATWDLYNRGGTHFLMAKQYVEELGGAFEQPGTLADTDWIHCYADDAIRGVANYHERFAYCWDSVVEHLHPGCGKGVSDEVYQYGESTMSQGLAMFQSKSHLWQKPA